MLVFTAAGCVVTAAVLGLLPALMLSADRPVDTLRDGGRGVAAALGVFGAMALSQALRSLLFEVTPTDPMTLGGVALVLTTVSLVACYVPARRAMRVDPVEALRAE